MTSIFDDIIARICSLNETHTIVYIAVGSSAGSIEYDETTNSWKIDPRLEQQFPPFLATLKEINYRFPTHIILIDSLLEDPPFVVCDSKKCMQDGWNQSENWYYNEITNMHVYSIRTNVTYYPYNDDGQLNINNDLQQLNLHAMEKNWFVIFHDFCGRNVGKLAEYFDQLLISHHDHIIYGLGARLDGGCYIDLTLRECQFEYLIDDVRITAFNPYQYNFFQLANINNDTNSQIVKSQIAMRIENIKQFFKDNFFLLVRQLALLKSGVHLTVNESAFKYISNLYVVDVKSMLDAKKYDELFEIILSLLECELSSHVEITIVKKSIEDMLKEQDIYKWTQHLESCLNIFYDNKN